MGVTTSVLKDSNCTITIPAEIIKNGDDAIINHVKKMCKIQKQDGNPNQQAGKAEQAGKQANEEPGKPIEQVGEQKANGRKRKAPKKKKPTTKKTTTRNKK